MLPSDQKYIGVPWKDGGRSFDGADCVGLATLWLTEHCGFKAPVPSSRQHGRATELLKDRNFHPAQLERGDLVFFSNKKGEVRHVAVWLGDGRLLHAFRGFNSRADIGFKLVNRIGLKATAAVKPFEAEILSEALADDQVGDVVDIVLIVVSIVLSVVSSLLAPRLARNGNKYGRYGFDGLITQISTEIPLPDIMGAVTVAGNSPYTQASDKNLSASAPNQRANRVVVFASGPVQGIDLTTGFKINGLTFSDKYFKNGSQNSGFYLNPPQTKAAAVEGTIGTDSYVPSITFYDGAHGTSVPVDIRASYDRTFPIYGFSGCSYAVFRLIDSSKFGSFNVTVRIEGRKCRTFNNNGFVVEFTTTFWNGDGTTRRFGIGYPDIKEVGYVTVNSVDWTEISASNQTGNIFYCNKLKGYIEFPDNIPGSGTNNVSAFVYLYSLVWTNNPASHILYLLTAVGTGMGFSEDRIDFPSFVAARDYFDEVVDWPNSQGVISGPRYTTNYSLDFRKPVQEHIRVLLDACRSVLFVTGGKFVLKPIKAESAVFSFDQSNILKESFASELVDRSEAPNRVKAFYHASDAYNAETSAIREDLADQLLREPRLGNGGVVEENLKYPAVDNQSQAERLAELHLRTQLNSRWRCSFKTTVLGLALEVGDVVEVTHPSQPGWAAKLFRVEDIKHDEDDRLEVQASEYFSSSEI